MSWWTFGSTAGLDQRAQPLMASDQGFVVEAENVGFMQAGVCVQRFGATTQSIAGSGFTGMIQWLGTHTTNAGVEELWGNADNTGTAALARRAPAWNPVTFSDTVNVNNLRYMHGASLNGKFFLAYDSDQNRLHVWDGTTLRRVGFLPAPDPTLMEMGGGAESFTRWYRVRYVELDADGGVVRRSEPSGSVSMTITNKVGIQVNQGALLNEGETDWEVEAAEDDAGSPGTFFRIATVDIGTTIYNDTSATIDTTDISALLGEYIPPPSAKYLLSDGARLLLGGAWELTASANETAPKQNRVWFTPVLGTTDEGDDERIPNTLEQQNFIDIGNAGPIVGLLGPLYGDIYVFKLDSIWKLVPTYDATTPYRAILVTDAIGAVDQRVMTQGEDGEGLPTLYFASSSTVYSLSQGGISDRSDPISRDTRLNNFTAALSVLAFDPFDKSLFAQTNTGISGTSGQYYQFKYDLKRRAWSGLSLGGADQFWVVGRSALGTGTILGETGTTVRSAAVAFNDEGQSRLNIGGENISETAALMAFGDNCAIDGSSVFTTSVRIRKFPVPGHLFHAGAPTIVYRWPSGTTTTTGTITASYYREDQAVMSESLTVSAAIGNVTDQDNPVQQKTFTFTGMQLADLSVLDLKLTMSSTAAFSSTIAPSIDSVMVPIDQNEPYGK
jgi:hypothetical protein